LSLDVCVLISSEKNFLYKLRVVNKNEKGIDSMKKIAYLLSIGLMFMLLGCGSAMKETPASESESSALLPAPPLSSKNQPEISMDEFTCEVVLETFYL
jgi:hypothetical protein